MPISKWVGPVVLLCACCSILPALADTPSVPLAGKVVTSIPPSWQLTLLQTALGRSREQYRILSLTTDMNQKRKVEEALAGNVDATVAGMHSSQGLSEQALSSSEEIKLMLTQVTVLVSNISTMNIEVSHAAQEQTCVTEAISRSLNDLAHVSGSASVDSEQLAQSGERLFQQGERLRTLVNSFRL